MSNESGKKPVVHKKHIARLERENKQTQTILYIFFGILGTVVLLLVYGWLDLNYLQLQRPVAKVGDANILVKDFEPRVRLYRRQLLNQYSQYQQYAQFFGMNVDAQLQQIESNLNSPAVIGQAVLDQMIKEELIRQEAAKRGITVTEDELNAEIEAVFGYFPNGTPTPSATPTEVVMPEIPAEAFTVVTATPLSSATPQATATIEPTQSAETTSEEGATEEAAATATALPTSTATATAEPIATATPSPTSAPLPTSTPFTAEGFQKLLSDTDDDLVKLGFDKDYYRSFFEVQILERKLKEVTAADIPAVETQVWARHILVSELPSAEDLIIRLNNGNDFATLAREFSVDTGSGAAGGDLGWFGRGAMVAEFEAAAFALENPGDITQTPVQSQFGYHIIQLIAKQDRPLSADQYAVAKDTAFEEWLTAVREEYAVETFDIWQERVPTEPNFISIATEAAVAQLTAQAEALEQFKNTQTPQP
jgi:peptidyl-prolyl cis-trans isomerase D